MATSGRPIRRSGKPTRTPPGGKVRTTTAYMPEEATYVDGNARAIHHAEGVEVNEREGKLVCTCMEYLDADWCNHVSAVITKGFDAAPAGDLARAHTEFVKYPNKMAIPMFPTKNLRDAAYQWVRIGSVEDDGSREVRLDVKNILNEFELLGWIFPGEGRNVIRNMILEWVRGHYHAASPCNSPIHKHVAWSKSDDRTQPLIERELVDLFLLIKHNECSVCHQFSDSSADAPDL